MTGEIFLDYKKDAVWNTLGNFFYMGALWLMSIVVVRLSNFENAGLFSVALTTSNIYISLGSYSMRLYYSADINYKFSDSQYFLARIITVILSLFCCGILSFFIGYRGQHLAAILLYYCFRSMEMMSDVLFGVLQRYGKLYLSGYLLIIRSIIDLFIYCGILYFTKNLNFSFGCMFLCSLIIFLCVEFPLAKKYSSELKISFFMNWKAALNILAICFPLFFVGLCYNIVPSVPRLVFERYYTTKELGYYSSIATSTVLISTCVNSLIIPLIPKLSEFFQQKQKKKLLLVSLLMGALSIGLGIVAIIAVTILGQPVMELIFGKEILSYLYLFPNIIIATTFTSIIICLNAIFVSINWRRQMLIGAIIGAILCFLTAVPFCQTFYMQGIAACLILSQLVEILFLISCLYVFFKKWNI